MKMSLAIEISFVMNLSNIPVMLMVLSSMAIVISREMKGKMNLVKNLAMEISLMTEALSKIPVMFTVLSINSEDMLCIYTYKF